MFQNGDTALHVAAANNHKGVCKFLLQKGHAVGGCGKASGTVGCQARAKKRDVLKIV